MTDYLPRNRILLEEAKQVTHPIRLQKMIGEGTHEWFVPCGKFHSESQQDVYTGLKFSINPLTFIPNWRRTLTNMAFISGKYPELSTQLPLFYGLLVSPAGKPYAAITEDFSKGGTHEVIEYRKNGHANIPDGLVELFDPFGSDMTQIEHSIFYVDGQRKIGDLNHLFVREKYMDEWECLQLSISNKDYTVPFSRVPLEQLFTEELQLRYAQIVLEKCADGTKNHRDLIHADLKYGLGTSTGINRVLDTLVDSFYLTMFRDQADMGNTKMFALAA